MFIFNGSSTRFFEKTTDKKLYTYRNILEYVDGEYLITNPITEENLRGMRENMDESDIEEFDKFVERHWKDNRKTKQAVEVSEQIKKPVRRGRKPKNGNQSI